MVRESRYNVKVILPDGRCIIANCLTHAVVSLSNKLLLEDESEALSDLGFIVSEHEIETAALKTAIDYVRFDKSSARLTICPTMSCNFRCPYCFQDHRPTHEMSEEVQEAVIQHVDQLLDDGIQEIDVSWFGGEPLLRSDIVETLTCEMRQLCIEKKAGYRSAIITNGYLMSPEVVSRLRKADPSGWSIQITLDGTRQTHNSRRALISGHGSYDEIVRNIKNATMDDLRIAIRVNIDKNNMGEFSSVASEFSGQANVSCYVSPVTIEATQSPQQILTCYSHSEQHDMWHQLVESGAVKLKTSDLLDVRISTCTAEHYYSSVIDPAGYMYKCVDETGKPEHAYAHLIDTSISRPEWKVKYTGRDILHEPECSDCSFIPLCQGGCYTQYAHNGVHNCSRVKHLLPSALTLE